MSKLGAIALKRRSLMHALAACTCGSPQRTSVRRAWYSDTRLPDTGGGISVAAANSHGCPCDSRAAQRTDDSPRRCIDWPHLAGHRRHHDWGGQSAHAGVVASRASRPRGAAGCQCVAPAHLGAGRPWRRIPLPRSGPSPRSVASSSLHALARELVADAGTDPVRPPAMGPNSRRRPVVT